MGPENEILYNYLISTDTLTMDKAFSTAEVAETAVCVQQ